MNWNSSAFRASAGFILVATLTIAACSDFLEVEDPGSFTDEALNDPTALQAVANGVESDLMTLIYDMAWNTGLMSDEYMHTGTWNPSDDLDKGRAPILGGSGGVQSTLLQRRTAAQRAQERFQNVMGDTANKNVLMARVVAAEGWANLLLGMNNCESPRSADGEIVPSVEMFKLAIPILTRAAGVARAANSTTYEHFAIGGRALANLYAGNLDAALADARLIPDNYVFTAKFSGNGPSNYIVVVSYRGRNKAAGLDSRHWAKVDTIAGFMRDPYTGQHDRRLGITHPRNERGADGVTQHYNQEKYTSIDADIPMVSGWEMRLVEAEVQLKKGNLTEAMALINKVRANAKLDPVTATTAAQVQQHLLWERFAQLYLQGKRLYDLQRFNVFASVIGTERPMQYPLDNTEIQLNSNTKGSLAGRCLPMS